MNQGFEATYKKPLPLDSINVERESEDIPGIQSTGFGKVFAIHKYVYYQMSQNFIQKCKSIYYV